MSGLSAAVANFILRLRGAFMSRSAPPPEPETADKYRSTPQRRIDPTSLPRVFVENANRPVCYVGARPPSDARVTTLSRRSLLETLGGRRDGVFVVDWASLRAVDAKESEWAALWTVADMRLNRLMMDACSLARRSGWRILIVGPVRRSEAPMFKTVAAAVEEIERDAFDALMAEAPR